jgi:hypothetical protein
MGCIEKEFKSKEYIENRIERFAFKEMNDDEELEFLLHITDCDSCEKEINTTIDFKKGGGRYFTHEDLTKAWENNDWAKVVELGNEMVDRGYLEEVYPIKDMVVEAKLRGLIASDEHDKINLEYSGQTLKGTIVEGCKLILDLFGNIELNKLFPTEVILTGDLSTHQTYPEEQEPSAIVETDNFVVKVFKGKLYAQFTIEPK